jgi:hypothetical protein
MPFQIFPIFLWLRRSVVSFVKHFRIFPIRKILEIFPDEFTRETSQYQPRSRPSQGCYHPSMR